MTSTAKLPFSSLASVPIVYFVQAGEAIRAGRSSHFCERYKTLQADNACTLNILGVVRFGDGMNAVLFAQRVMAMFAQAIIHDDWFHPVPELLAYIDSVVEHVGSTPVVEHGAVSTAASGPAQTRLVDPLHAARYLNVELRVVKRLLDAGTLRAYRVGRNSIRLSMEDLERVVASDLDEVLAGKRSG